MFSTAYKWIKKQNPSVVNLTSVCFNLAQSFLLIGIIGRAWAPSMLGELLAIEASINLLLLFPNLLADIAGYELLKEASIRARDHIYRVSTHASYIFAGALSPFVVIILIQPHSINSFLLVTYALVRLMTNPILGCMGKRMYSDKELNLCFLLGALDQLLIYLPAFIAILIGHELKEAIIIACFIRVAQAVVQLRILNWLFPIYQNASHQLNNDWTVRSLITRTIMLSPSQLPTPLLQNSTSLIIASLIGQANLAIFNTHRTAAGFLGQFSNALMEPKYPDMLKARNKINAAWLISFKAQRYIFPLVPIMFIAFPYLYPIWMGSKYPIDMMLFLALLLIQIFRQVQQPLAMLLRSLNKFGPNAIENWTPLILIWVLLAILEPNNSINFALILLASEFVLLALRITLSSLMFRKEGC